MPSQEVCSIEMSANDNENFTVAYLISPETSLTYIKISRAHGKWYVRIVNDDKVNWQEGLSMVDKTQTPLEIRQKIDRWLANKAFW